MEEIHIGHIIQTELRRQGRSVTWFARQIPCDRTNVYDIFRRDNIDIRLLLRISRILNHDFFSYLSRAL
ncbi:MAG: XRE family transcriptional regulator [Paludibacteraceae bacterium]|nr:XRE family transcriptional regulator [Paludibacteraceae bacterium]